MRDAQEFQAVNGLVRNINAVHGAMGAVISVAIIAVVAWVAMKEFTGMLVNVMERLGS